MMDCQGYSSRPSSRDRHVQVSMPKELTCFSRDATLQIHFGSRENLRTYNQPQLPQDLNQGQQLFVDKQAKGNIEDLINSLHHANVNILAQATVLSYRNNFNKIAITPYNITDAWEIDAFMIEDTMFLDIVQRDESEEEKARFGRFTYYGYKFEEICTRDKSEKQVEGDKVVVNANEEFCRLVRFTMGQHEIILGAEIDCELKEPNSQSPTYVELKTLLMPKNKFHQQKYENNKYIRFWVQSYLGGVPRIKVGYRDEAGTLLRIDDIMVKDLGSRSVNPHYRWDPFVCLNFLNQVLSFARKEIKHQLSQKATPENQVFSIQYNPDTFLVSVKQSTRQSAYKIVSELVHGQKEV